MSQRPAHWWHRLDDGWVDRVSPTAFKDPYLLFYQNTSLKQYSRQEISLPHLWPHQVTAVNPRRFSEVSLNDSTMSTDSFQLSDLAGQRRSAKVVHVP